MDDEKIQKNNDNNEMKYYDDYNPNNYKALPKKALKSIKYVNNGSKSNEQKNESIISDNGIDRRYKINKILTHFKTKNKRKINIDLSKYIIQLKMEFDDDVYNGSGVIINIKNNIVYILTAGHNIMNINDFHGTYTKADNIWCNINNKWYHTSTYYEYNKYKLNNKEMNDIGLIKVYINDDLMFYNVFPELISINDVNLNDDNNDCFIYGYPADNKNRLGELWGMNGKYNIVKNKKYCNELLYYNNIDTSGGQSGSPIFIYNNNIIGIHTMGNDLNKKENYGCALTKKKINWINNIINNNNNNDTILKCNKNINISCLTKKNDKIYWNYDFNVFKPEGMICQNVTSVGINSYALLYTNIQNELFLKKRSNHFSDPELFKSLSVKVISHGLSNGHGFIYTTKNELYRIQTRRGKFGIPSPPTLINYKFDSPIKEIACGNDSTLILTENGNVYGCGDNLLDRLSPEHQKKRKDEIRTIIDTSNIIKVGCTCHTGFVLDKQNTLKAFGEIFTEFSIFIHPYNGISKIFDEPVTNFDSGGHHIGLLTKNKCVYMMGSNIKWQCGKKHTDGDYSDSHCPKNKINIDKTFIDVKCGYAHTIIKTDNNKYYSFGENTHKQLLINNNDECCLPTLISFEYIKSITNCNDDIIDLIPGYQTTFILQ